MAYSRWYIDFENADDAAFSVNVGTYRLYVLTGNTDIELIGESKEYFQHITKRERRGKHHIINVEAYPYFDDAGDWDTTDYRIFLTFCNAKEFLRITASTVRQLNAVFGSTADFSGAEIAAHGLTGLFPLRVDLLSYSKSLNKSKPARHEVTYQFQTVYPS